MWIFFEGQGTQGTWVLPTTPITLRYNDSEDSNSASNLF